MKKLLVVAIVSSLSTVYAASDLDLEVGQYSFSVQSTDLNMSSRNDNMSNAVANYNEDDKSSSLNLTGYGQYGYSEKINLGLYVGVFLDSDSYVEDTAGTVVSSKMKSLNYAIEPSIEFSVTPDIALYGAAYYYSNTANETTDQDGLKSFNGDSDYTNLTLTTGAIYKKDIKPNLMLELDAMVHSTTLNWVDAVDPALTSKETYFGLSAGATGHYFFANNFSADIGLTYSREAYTGLEVDGNDIDFGDWEYMDSGLYVNTGFTFFFR